MWNELERLHIMECTSMTCKNKNTSVILQAKYGGALCVQRLANSNLRAFIHLNIVYRSCYCIYIYIYVCVCVCAFCFTPQAYGCFIFEVKHLDLRKEFVTKMNILSSDICGKYI
jgi:hypothetical protein